MQVGCWQLYSLCFISVIQMIAIIIRIRVTCIKLYNHSQWWENLNAFCHSVSRWSWQSLSKVCNYTKLSQQNIHSFPRICSTNLNVVLWLTPHSWQEIPGSIEVGDPLNFKFLTQCPMIVHAQHNSEYVYKCVCHSIMQIILLYVHI